MKKQKVIGKNFTSLDFDREKKGKPVKVLVAMSGGVDSSVAAALMKKKGYDVVGVFLKCYSDTKNEFGTCNWIGEKEYARTICLKLGIPLLTIDAEAEYKKYVVEEMFNDYKKGITPNPDILCNEVVKFPFLFKMMKKINADYVVTGHYAKIVGKKLLRAKDENKDQSYFLYRLNEKDLSSLKFPIGDYTKKEVRAMAKKLGFANHNKKSTVGICFIGKIPMKSFLKTKIKEKKGNIIDCDGSILGQHDGVYYYTIGQRIGPRYDLHIKKKDSNPSQMARWYVAGKNIKKNELIVAPAGSPILFRKDIIIRDFYLINEGVEKFKKKTHKVYARIRHVGELIPSKLFWKGGKWNLTLGQKLDGVSDGQAVVLYNGKQVLGGGEISSR